MTPHDQLERDYALLDVAASAGPDEIRSAYRLLVAVWHPDRFGHDAKLQRAAEEKMKAINDAFARIEEAPLLRLPPPQAPGRPRDFGPGVVINVSTLRPGGRIAAMSCATVLLLALALVVLAVRSCVAALR